MPRVLVSGLTVSGHLPRLSRPFVTAGDPHSVRAERWQGSDYATSPPT
jgi:hypothetical protein